MNDDNGRIQYEYWYKHLNVLNKTNGWLGITQKIIEKVSGLFGDPEVKENGDSLVSIFWQKGHFVLNMWIKCSSKSIYLHAWKRNEYKSKSMTDMTMMKDERICKDYEKFWIRTDNILAVSIVKLEEKYIKETRMNVEWLREDN